MRRAIKKGTVLIAAAVLLTGCGEEMAPLTESEEAIVIQYSAGTLAKHNSYQQEGMTALYPEEEEEQEEEQEPEEKKEEKKTESEEKNKKEETDSKDKKEDNKEKDTAQTEEAGQLTLSEALAVSGVEVSYKDYSVSSSYKQGEYFSLDAAAGNTFLIMNMNITNTGSQAVDCDLLTKQPIFTLKLNQGAGVKNEVTILSNDLSTYVGKLEPGQTDTAVLLFEVPEKTAESISSVQLSVQMNQKTNQIKLK